MTAKLPRYTLEAIQGTDFLTPTQLFNRPVRVCFHLENMSSHLAFPVSHTVKNSGC